MTGQKINWKKVIHGICIFIIVMGMFRSCQGNSRTPKSITLYYGPSDYAELDQMLEHGAYEEAVNFCLEKLKEAPENSVKEMELYTLIGEIYGSYIGDRDQAVYYLNQAIEKARSSQNQSRLADACYSMTKVYVNLGGDVNEGLKYAEEAEKIYRDVAGEHAVETADAVYRKGELYYDNGQWEKALESFKSAVEVYKLNQKATEEAYAYIGNTLIKLEEYEGAENAFCKAQEQSEKAGNEYQYALSSLYLGKLYVEEGEYDKATENYNKALNFFEADLDYSRVTALVFNHLAYCCKEKSGNWQDGIEYAIKSCQVTEETGVSTEEEKEDQREYKRILKEKYYNEWKPEATDEEFQIWYQRVVLDGEDWEEG